MTTMEQEPGRSLGYIEGRLEEQSKAIELLHTDLKDGLAELSRRLDAGLQEVRAGQRQILITNLDNRRWRNCIGSYRHTGDDDCVNNRG